MHGPVPLPLKPVGHGPQMRPPVERGVQETSGLVEHPPLLTSHGLVVWADTGKLGEIDRISINEKIDAKRALDPTNRFTKRIRVFNSDLYIFQNEFNDNRLLQHENSWIFNSGTSDAILSLN